ncbi:MAG: UDP-N-acetylmuramate--L-alanine ligase [Anaerobutyricum sp.]|nr:UDP-N-acetylmuramate--L-alanine ligase [Eubacterium sp.]MDY6047672.1 UDP-N-acetylmuramate--L-alanine ligase [Anaerobutyricum sp.]
MYTINFQKPIHIHFIGIGGISMSGLAEILLDRKFTVSGSDMKASEITEHLGKIGARIAIGQRAENITDDIDLVVYTAAIHEENEEFAAAKNKNIPMMTRAALLGQIMDNYARSIAVAGTHGKTTTTSMLTHILLQGQLDPTVSVGGMLDRIGGNIRVGQSNVFLTEACEYTNSFLEFHPLYSIILNVEEDHMDFFKDLEDIKHSFHLFASQTAPDGLIIINGDMEHTDDILKDLPQKAITFGLNGDNDYTATDISFDKEGNGSYQLVVDGENMGPVSLKVKGRHNIMNSLAAIACARALGLPMKQILTGLLSFGGTHRRFEYKGNIGDVIVIDDYAHHPTEIKATLTAAREYPHDELWVVFQPHTYTRTKAFLHQFAEVLTLADHVVLADIYAAREPDTGMVSSRDIVNLLKEAGTDVYYFPTFGEIEDFLLSQVKGHDLLITMGAGDVVNIGEDILRKTC